MIQKWSKQNLVKDLEDIKDINNSIINRLDNNSINTYKNVIMQYDSLDYFCDTISNPSGW